MRVPPNNVAISQKFANDVRANKARCASNLPVDRSVRAHTIEVENEGEMVHIREW